MKKIILEYCGKIKDNKKVTLYVLVGIILIVGAFFFFNTEEELVAEKDGEITSKNEATVEDETYIIIEIAGSVKTPTVVELPEGSRVFEAIEAAGGLLAEANTVNINKAAILQDGERVYIPSTAEVEYESEVADGKVNINTADSQTLQTLNGVGPSTADKIIAYREDNGPFSKVEDLMNVSGIGKKTFEKLQDGITI